MPFGRDVPFLTMSLADNFFRWGQLSMALDGTVRLTLDLFTVNI